MTVERVLVIGLGSMGRRRVRNLRRLGVPSIVAFDPRADRCDQARAETPELETVDDVAVAFDRAPGAVVISTPPDLHVAYAREAVRRRLPFFTEASIDDGERDLLLTEVRQAGIVAAPSCTLRFHPSVRTMKGLFDDGRVGRLLAYTHHSGQYLPDWHPWEDYRTFYAGRRRTGACREIVPFELTWLTWIAGPVESVTAFKGKTSDLDVDIDDVYQLLGRHHSGTIGHLLVDAVAREPTRRCTLLGSSGTIRWDWAARTVWLYDATKKRTEAFEESAGTVRPGYVHAEEPYVDEMEAYLAAVAGERPWTYPLEDELATLRILAAAERSSDEGRQIALT